MARKEERAETALESSEVVSEAATVEMAAAK